MQRKVVNLSQQIIVANKGYHTHYKTRCRRNHLLVQTSLQRCTGKAQQGVQAVDGLAVALVAIASHTLAAATRAEFD